MGEFLDLANNPLFIRHVRSRLRRSAVLPGLVIVLFCCLCIIFIDDLWKNPNGPSPAVGSQMIFWLQGLILVLMGGSQVAASIAQMKESGIIDFHRITPIPPRVQAVGIMLGAPIRELILYSITLPFAFYLAIDGPVGVANFAKLVLVQVGSAMMYYSLAMITGLTGSRARGASGRFVGVLAALNIGATMFFPMGLYGPTLITSYPVYYEVFIEKEEIRAAIQQNQAQQQVMQQGNKGGKNQPAPIAQPPIEVPKLDIPFFGMHPPVVLQTLLFQGSLLTFLFIAAARRIHSARLPLYHKSTALIFFTTISVLTLGSLWSMPTIFLCLGSVYFLTFCAILLTMSVTPSLGDVVKGLQRAHKLSGMRVPLWSDLSSNRHVVLGFAFILAAGVSLGLRFAPQPPNAGPVPVQQLLTPWPPLIVGILTVLTNGFAVQYFGLAYGNRAKSFFFLFIFFAWFVPIIIAIIALMGEFDQAHYLLAVSPLVGIFMSGMVGIPKVDDFIVKIVSIAPVAICAVMFFFLLVAEERRRARRVTGEHAQRGRSRPDREHEEYAHE